MATFYTLGHSTRSLEDLMETLRAQQIQTLIHIRAFPRSRRLPQCNGDSMEKSLPAAPIRYLWMKALGGYRKKITNHSPNVALRNDGFRHYAAYMLTPGFQSAAAELIALAQRSRTAYMCAERLYFRCHRLLLSDWLVAHGHEVLHIEGVGPVKPHHLTAEARMIDGKLIYRGDRLL